METEPDAGVRLEVCVDSLSGALRAVEGGADRIELCSDLVLGGTTPSAGLVQAARAGLEVPLVVLVRPRAGDFVYDAEELEVMERDVAWCRAAGVEGVALGALKEEGELDFGAMQRLIRAAGPLAVVFHRAFDVAREPLLLLEQLADLGVARILTSGQAERASAGVELLRELVQAARGRLAVMAGGGVGEADAAQIVRASGVRDVHVSATLWRDGPMRYRSPAVRLSSARPAGEHERRETDVDRVRAFRAALGPAGRYAPRP